MDGLSYPNQSPDPTLPRPVVAPHGDACGDGLYDHDSS